MLALGSTSCDGIGANPPPARSGTAPAIITSSKVHGHLGKSDGQRSHGGARNRADRVSYQLTEKQVRNIFAAVARANAIGLPLNRHWTVHWDLAGVTDDKAGAATRALLTLVRDWLRKQGHRFACVWVRENDEGDGSKGSHVHILLHVPAGVRWCGWRNRRWVKRVTGRDYVSRTSRTRTIGRSAGAAKTSPGSFLANSAVVCGYISKSAPARVLELLAVSRGAEMGKIVGKRWGRSQSLATSD